MRFTYRPERTKHWTDADLAELVGKYVVVDVPASEAFRRNPLSGGGNWEGAGGVCEEAVVDASDWVFVVFDDRIGWDWNRNDGAYVSVCDEHGDHTSLNGVVCLETLGPAARAATEAGER